MTDWLWIDDDATQGRAIVATTGLTLLVIWRSGYVYAHWRVRGVCFAGVWPVPEC